MATINLGNLTFTHKGDYAGGTAYVKNDVVYYATNGNSYIAKTSTTGNAPTSTAHWDLFVSGSGGIFSSALALGSASQKLRVNSGGTALEFFTEPAVTSDYVKIHSTGSVSNSSYLGVNGHFSADYDLYEIRFLGMYSSGTNSIYARIYSDTSGTVRTSDYTNTQTQVGRATSGSTYHSENGAHNNSYWWLQDSMSPDAQARSNGIYTFYNPLATDRYTIMSYHQAYMDGTSWVEPNWGMGMHQNTGACYGFAIYSASGNTFYADDIVVYGIKT